MKLQNGPIICDAIVISVQESSTLKVKVNFWFENEEMSGHFFVIKPETTFKTGQKLKLNVEFFFPAQQLIVCNVA